MADEPHVLKLTSMDDERLSGYYVAHSQIADRPFYWHVTLTQDAKEARIFPGFTEAFERWRLQSDGTPLCPDGKPNRPLTVWHAEAIKLNSLL